MLIRERLDELKENRVNSKKDEKEAKKTPNYVKRFFDVFNLVESIDYFPEEKLKQYEREYHKA